MSPVFPPDSPAEFSVHPADMLFHSLAGCVVVVSVIEQLAQVHNSTAQASMERLCSYLPGKYGEGRAALGPLSFPSHLLSITHQLSRTSLFPTHAYGGDSDCVISINRYFMGLLEIKTHTQENHSRLFFFFPLTFIFHHGRIMVVNHGHRGQNNEQGLMICVDLTTYTYPDTRTGVPTQSFGLRRQLISNPKWENNLKHSIDLSQFSIKPFSCPAEEGED